MGTRAAQRADQSTVLPSVSPLDLQGKPYLSLQEASLLTGLGQWSLRHFIRKGDLRAAKIGNRVLIEKRDLADFIERKKRGVVRGEYPSIAKRREKAAKS